MAKKEVARSYDFSTYPSPNSVLGQQYYYVTLRFWPSLVFVTPFLLVYEIGRLANQAGPSSPNEQLVAAWLIESLVRTIGVSGYYFPAPTLLTVAVLLACHLVAKHPWKFDIWVLAGMLGESLIYTIPLIVLRRIPHTAIMATGSASYDTWLNEVIRSFGGGIYEELVFRFICMNVLHIFLVDLCRFPRTPASVVIIFASAVIFAGSHHWPLGSEQFNQTEFFFRTFAGLYLAGLYFFRGFGVAAGCHSFYNVLVYTLVALRG
ncbi:MAG: CPBP family intramembrane metalloprotease [Planctomycetes bacterium]|nr:CPBP family intramembrane metalloprotease [Planctomycetota bacterium]